ncbi:porin family protein [Marinobacter hydrocarbonoclasticus]|nr:porin family protein [Marinobacter nauticus]
MRIIVLILALFSAQPAFAWFDLSGKRVGFSFGEVRYDTDGLYRDYDYDKRDISFGIYTAAPVNDWIDLEVHYTHLGQYEVRESVFHYWKDTFHSLSLAARFHTDVANNLELYGRAGFGVILLEQDAILWEGGTPLALASGGGELQFSVGAAWRFHRHVALTLEYDHHSFLVESGYSGDHLQSLSGVRAGLRYTF